MIHDPPHGNVRESVNQSGAHEEQPHRKAPQTQHLCVEYHQIIAGKYKAEIVSEVPEHIAQLVPESEGPHRRFLRPRIFSVRPRHSYLPENDIKCMNEVSISDPEKIIRPLP